MNAENASTTNRGGGHARRLGSPLGHNFAAMRRASIPLLIALTAVPPQLAQQAAASGPAARRPAATAPQRAKVTYDAYILGPGDSLQVELLDIPELSGIFAIGPDGTIYLPRLRALYVEGLTVEELRYFLTQQFKAYVKNPQLYVRPVGYRPIRIYVGGEVRRPGYYTLSGVQMLQNQLNQQSKQSNLAQATGIQDAGQRFSSEEDLSGGSSSSSSTLFPTVFDAIRTAQGITPYSDIAQVQVTRKQPLSGGGGRIRTNLNFLSLITEGNESQNIPKPTSARNSSRCT